MKFKKLFGCLALSSLLALGVGVGLSARQELKMADAYGTGDTTWHISGTFNSWDLEDEDTHLTYSGLAGEFNNNWQFDSDKTISLSKGDGFLVTFAYNDGGIKANYFRPALRTNSVDFYYEDGANPNIIARRDITVSFYFQIYSEDPSASSGTALYWAETTASKQAAADAFGTEFLTATSDYCTVDLTTDEITALRTSYNNLGGAQDAFYGADVIRGKGGVDYGGARNEALSRYVNMIEEKGYEDSTFLNLGEHYPSSLKYVSNFAGQESSNNGVIIIVTISVISLAAIGGYFLLRRRKED